MKTIYVLSILLMIIILGSCTPQSVHKDMTTGAYSRGDGLACSDINIKINKKKVSRNTFSYGERIYLEFNNMSGFKKTNKFAYPGMKLSIIKNGKDTVMHKPDLFNELKEGTNIQPLLLSAHFLATLTYQNSEQYKVHVLIWDKKGEGTFTYELPFVVEENKLLIVKSNAVNYDNMYLWNETQQHTISDNKLSQHDEMLLIMQGVEGLNVLDGMVYPILAIELKDNQGRVLIDNKSLLPQYETEGFDAEQFTAGQVPVTIRFDQGKLSNPYTLNISLKDKTSEKSLNVQTKLMLH